MENKYTTVKIISEGFCNNTMEELKSLISEEELEKLIASVKEGYSLLSFIATLPDKKIVELVQKYFLYISEDDSYTWYKPNKLRLVCLPQVERVISRESWLRVDVLFRIYLPPKKRKETNMRGYKISFTTSGVEKSIIVEEKEIVNSKTEKCMAEINELQKG